jgi:hypothetical protein
VFSFSLAAHYYDVCCILCKCTYFIYSLPGSENFSDVESYKYKSARFYTYGLFFIEIDHKFI